LRKVSNEARRITAILTTRNVEIEPRSAITATKTALNELIMEIEVSISTVVPSGNCDRKIETL